MKNVASEIASSGNSKRPGRSGKQLKRNAAIINTKAMCLRCEFAHAIQTLGMLRRSRPVPARSQHSMERQLSEHRPPRSTDMAIDSGRKENPRAGHHNGILMPAAKMMPTAISLGSRLKKRVGPA